VSGLGLRSEHVLLFVFLLHSGEKSMYTINVTLTERESQVLHAVERSIAHWSQEVKDRNYSGRDERERDMCVAVRDEMIEIRNLILGD